MNTSSAKVLDGVLSVTAASPSPDPVAPVLPVRRDEAKTFLREFTRELLREISPAAKTVWLMSIAVLVIVVLYLGYATFQGYRAQQQQSLSQAETLTRRIDQQEKVLAQLSERQDQPHEQISVVAKTGPDFKPNNQPASYGPSLPTKLWSSYSKGICLIAGSYVLIDRATGRPLRYPEVEMSSGESLRTMGTEGTEGSDVTLTPEGNVGPSSNWSSSERAFMWETVTS